MNDTAIKVEGASKLYHIGASKTYKTARESVMSAMSAPLRLARKFMGSSTPTADPTDLWALKDISFEVKRGDVLGIVGRNGAGKSTLLKVLSRITEPTAGRIKLHGRVGSLLEVGTGFHPELTGRENIFLNGAILGMRRSEIAGKFDEIVAFAETEKFIDTPVKHYSSGMYTRLAFAVAAHLEPEILIIDEVLAVGDAAFQKKCLGKMKNIAVGGRTVLFVTHNMSALLELCNTALVLQGGKVVMQGSPTSAVTRYMESRAAGSISFENGPVRRADATYTESGLDLQVWYQLEHPQPIVCLGFVVTDSLGRPLFGSNPLVAGEVDFGRGSLNGTIHAKVTEPQLAVGTYSLSLWFGDGQQNEFEQRDCLSFEVGASSRSRPLSIGTVGSIIPKCEWNIR